MVKQRYFTHFDQKHPIVYSSTRLVKMSVFERYHIKYLEIYSQEWADRIQGFHPQFQDFSSSISRFRSLFLQLKNVTFHLPNVVEVLFYAYNKHFIHFWSGIFTQIFTELKHSISRFRRHNSRIYFQDLRRFESFILQNIHSNIPLD